MCLWYGKRPPLSTRHRKNILARGRPKRGEECTESCPWCHESWFRAVYDKLRKSDQVAYAGSVLRRARQLTQLPVLKYGLGQRDMVLNFRRIIDNNQSIIINLALHNPDARRLLGCFL